MSESRSEQLVGRCPTWTASWATWSIAQQRPRSQFLPNRAKFYGTTFVLLDLQLNAGMIRTSIIPKPTSFPRSNLNKQSESIHFFWEFLWIKFQVPIIVSAFLLTKMRRLQAQQCVPMNRLVA